MTTLCNAIGILMFYVSLCFSTSDQHSSVQSDLNQFAIIYVIAAS